MKRHMNRASPTQVQNPDIASLATLGMRIRKSIADGYALTQNAELSYDPQYFSRLETPKRPAFERVQLPNGMDAPPALCNSGSTFQSGLNVSQWGNDMPVNFSTLGYQSGTKRSLEDSREGFEKIDYQPPSVMSLPSYDEFRATNGQLSFNEDF